MPEKEYTEEQIAAMAASRIESDASILDQNHDNALIAEQATFVPGKYGPRLELSVEQIKEAKEE